MKDQEFLEAVEHINANMDTVRERMEEMDKSRKYVIDLLTSKAEEAHKRSMFQTTTIRDTALETGKSMAYKDAAQILRNMHSLCSQLPPSIDGVAGA